ncbi:MAG TPA: ABC transporter permease [Candidatus Saccharimonadales bacterium]|nr:ABC transporter permease [Candidatus Saccharimonadales bacterium]
MTGRIVSLFRNLLRRSTVEQALDEELNSAVELLTAEKMKEGLRQPEARREALMELGGIEQVKEEVRAIRLGGFVDSLGRDLRFAARQLRRNPGITVTVVVTLALAIGANTAIFSLVNALMLKSLPYAHAERLGTIYTRITGAQVSDERHHLDGEQWELLRDNVPSLMSAISGVTSGVNLQAGSQMQYVRDGRVSAEYFDVLGMQPIIGRSFSVDEDRPHGAEVAILSYGIWKNLFASDRDIAGRAILLRGEPYTVIGVLPEGATTPLNADVYTPLQASRDGEGGGTNFDVITRLKDGGSWQQADAEINRTWSARNGRYELKDSPGAQVTYHTVALQKGETDTLRPQALALMLSAGFILLIACANLAGLTLVRVLRRAPEVATRLALGASRWQIQKQFWVESLLLALAGGAAGIAVGFLALRGLLVLLPEHFLPVASVGLDLRVLLFSALVTVFTSVLFGMLPALAARKLDLRSSMASRGVAGMGGVTLRKALIAGEVSLAVVLLAGSGLLIRSLIHLETLAPGFNPDGVLVAKVSLDDVRYHDPAAFRKLLDESTAAMRRIPGVQNAAVGLSLPYERTVNDQVMISDGKEAGLQDNTDLVYVTPGYFATLQMPVLAGRVFSDEDGATTQRVAVVNQAFARKFYGGSNPVGRYVNKGTLIVGEVADVSVSSGIYAGAPLMSEQAMYIPAAQVEPQYLPVLHVWFQPDWIVRTAGPVESLSAGMQRALSSADPNLPTSGFYSMKDLQARTLAMQRIEVALLGVMAGLALLLSTVGIFALVANLVAQRTREIGIRMALGSTASQAMLEIGRLGASAALLGVVIGLALSAGALRAMRSLVYGVDVYDAPTLAGVVLILVCATLAATVLPTRKIASIDPARTLREE